MDIYENLADENVSAPNNPHVAQFSGEDAAKIMQTLISEDSDATEIFASLSGPGRPNSKEKREISVQERFRVPKSWSEYISRAAKRDGLPNKSKYLQSLILRDAQMHNEQCQLQAVLQ